MGKRQSSKQTEYEWEVIVIRKRGERLKRVTAPDIEKAVDKAIEQSGYRGDRKRLIAWRVG